MTTDSNKTSFTDKAKETAAKAKTNAKEYRGILGLVSGIVLTLVVVAAKGYRDSQSGSTQS
jgi:hypothetical protein